MALRARHRNSPDFGMPTRPAISTDWREGRFYDRWMLVHFVSGVAGGFGNLFFAFTARGALGVALAVMVAWELGEALLGVSEAWSNRLIDIAVGLSGAGLALLVAARLTPNGQRVAFAITLAVAVASSAAGWVAYRRRTRAT